MIESAEEFVALRSSEVKAEYDRSAYEEAPAQVWREVIDKYPDYQWGVIHNKTVPLEILDALSRSDDARIRGRIATKRKLSPELFERLAKDADADVRGGIAGNKKTPRAVLEILRQDSDADVAERAVRNIQSRKLEGGFELTYARPDETGAALIFPFVGENLLIGVDTALPSVETLQALGDNWQAVQFGKLEGQPCELRVWSQTTPLSEGLTTGDFRRLWGVWSPERLEALIRARQLAAWLAQHRFCGVCGQATEIHPTEPAYECPACGHKVYPRISPVCMGLVLKGNQLLLARSPRFAPGVYSALAGFVEAGESAEAALRREVFEESGVRIKNIRWFGSQSWPYPHALMLGFLADYASGELVAQESEIEDLGWFDFDKLPALPHPASLAYRMIEHVRKRKANP